MALQSSIRPVTLVWIPVASSGATFSLSVTNSFVGLRQPHGSLRGVLRVLVLHAKERGMSNLKLGVPLIVVLSVSALPGLLWGCSVRSPSSQGCCARDRPLTIAAKEPVR